MYKRQKNKKQETRKRVAIIVTIVALLFIMFRKEVGQGVESLSHILFPVQKKIYEIGEFFKISSNKAVTYKQVLEENRKLREEQVKYELLLVHNEELAKENARLREILGMRDTQMMNIKVAKINFRNPNNLYERFYIDLGSKNGIEKDFVVLSGENLIGKVSKVYEDYSVVEMITGENFAVSTKTEKGALGVVKGSDIGDGTLYFEANTFDESVEIDEKVYTSGISEIYPKGLYIGKISQVSDDTNEILKSIKVKTEVDIINLSEVLILMPNKNKAK